MIYIFCQTVPEYLADIKRLNQVIGYLSITKTNQVTKEICLNNP